METIESIRELYNFIQKIGFLPLFSNSVTGFSVEDHTRASAWWTGDPETDPWVWRQILASDQNIAYGKFFDKKAGFISRKWLPVFANYRRNGYDYDALYDDGFASFKSKRIMDVFELDEHCCGKSLLSPEVRRTAGFVKKEDKAAFDAAITELQMQMYLIASDFIQKRDKKGRFYGWPVSLLETPETKWGYPYVTGNYKEDPAMSWEKIRVQVMRHFPDAEEKHVKKVLGIRYPGVDEIKVSKPEEKNSGQKHLRPRQLPWPENLITEIGLELVFGKDEYIPLSDDQMEGLRFALDSLNERERQVVRYRYEDHLVLREIAEKYGVKSERIRQISAKGIRNLKHPSRIRYYTNGYQKTLESDRKKIEMIRTAADPETQINLLSEIPLGGAGFTTRTYNCLKRAGMTTLGDVAGAMIDDPSSFQEIRNLGRGSMSEINRVMEDCGFDIRRLQKPEFMRDRDISCLDLDIMSRKALYNAGYRKVSDIADMIEKDAKEIFLVRNFRKKSISELCDKLEKLGFDCMNLRKLDFLL